MRFDSSTADRLTGLILLTLGISMLAGGYMMDRLEIRQIHPASIPGLVPMGLGAAMAICALLLIGSTRQSATKGTDSADDSIELAEPELPGSYKNLTVTALLCVAYAAGLVGNVPFVVATGIFIFLFSVYFLWPEPSGGNRGKLRIGLLCAVYAATFAIGISVLFRYGFLVRLP